MNWDKEIARLRQAQRRKPYDHEDGSASKLPCPACDSPKDRPCFYGYHRMALSWMYCKARIAALLATFTLLAASGCRPPVQAAEPESDEVPQWCVSIEGWYKGRPLVGKACATIREACDEARVTARRFGKYRGVRSVGECKWEES